MFTLEKELLGKQEETPKDGKKEERTKSHMAWLLADVLAKR